MNQERAKEFIRDFDEVLEKLKETAGVEGINKVKEYFVNEYPETFCVEYSFKETNIKAERIAKHSKEIKDVEETLLTSISMEPFMNYEDIGNDKTLSTIQKIVLCKKAIDDKKRKQIYFAANQGKLLERCFIQGRDIYNRTLRETGVSRRWAHFLLKLIKLIEDHNQLSFCTFPSRHLYKFQNHTRNM